MFLPSQFLPLNSLHKILLKIINFYCLNFSECVGLQKEERNEGRNLETMQSALKYAHDRNGDGGRQDR